MHAFIAICMPGFEDLSLITVGWVALVLAYSGMVQGALGLGFPMLATPMIAAVTDMRTAVILVLLPCVAATLMNVIRAGQFVTTLKRFWFVPICTVGGTFVGAHLFVAFPAFPYAVLLAVVMFAYLYLDHIGQAQWHVVQRHPFAFGIFFGCLAGLSEGTANIAAPLLLIYLFSLGVDRTTLVQLMNICFSLGKPTQFVVLTTDGGVTWIQWAMTLPFAVVAGAMTYVGINIRSRIEAETYRRWLLQALFLIALALMLQYGYQQWQQ